MLNMKAVVFSFSGFVRGGCLLHVCNLFLCDWFCFLCVLVCQAAFSIFACEQFMWRDVFYLACWRGK